MGYTELSLNDALFSVMAGLGCIGKNNLVITPEYGPRIRFRALLLDQEAEATGPFEFNPCEGCTQPCRKSCPIKAFQNTVYLADALGQSKFPGINGTYDRVTCNMKIEKDIEKSIMAMSVGAKEHQAVRLAIDKFDEGVLVKPKGYNDSCCCIKYCRRCELSCPVGKQGDGLKLV